MATPADVAISAALSAAAAAFYSAYVAAQGHAVPHLAATATALTATVRRYAGIAVERLAIVQSAGKSYAAAVDTGGGLLDGLALLAPRRAGLAALPLWGSSTGVLLRRTGLAVDEQAPAGAGQVAAAAVRASCSGWRVSFAAPPG